MIRIKPPESLLKTAPFKHKIFLAGSIEMGKAEDWQTKVEQALYGLKDVIVMNPRRDKWDNSIVQSPEDPTFYQQVSWELSGLDKATKIIMYFDPNSKSPISLLELGLYADSGKLEIICPSGFYRKGNIEMVCSKYNIPLYENLDKYLETFNL